MDMRTAAPVAPASVEPLTINSFLSGARFTGDITSACCDGNAKEYSGLTCSTLPAGLPLIA